MNEEVDPFLELFAWDNVEDPDTLSWLDYIEHSVYSKMTTIELLNYIGNNSHSSKVINQINKCITKLGNYRYSKFRRYLLSALIGPPYPFPSKILPTVARFIVDNMNSAFIEDFKSELIMWLQRDDTPSTIEASLDNNILLMLYTTTLYNNYDDPFINDILYLIDYVITYQFSPLKDNKTRLGHNSYKGSVINFTGSDTVIPYINEVDINIRNTLKLNLLYNLTLEDFTKVIKSAYRSKYVTTQVYSGNPLEEAHYSLIDAIFYGGEDEYISANLNLFPQEKQNMWMEYMIGVMENESYDL